jgi:hypothetical protein
MKPAARSKFKIDAALADHFRNRLQVDGKRFQEF